MNANPELASTWKGRILMHVSAEKTDKPLLLVKDLSDTDIEASRKYIEQREFEVIAEVGLGISLPKGLGVMSIAGSNEKFSVMIKIGDYEIKTEKAVYAENTYNRWNFRYKQACFTAPYTDVYDIGRVYVYLLYGTTPICFWKGDSENFLDPNPKYQWI